MGLNVLNIGPIESSARNQQSQRAVNRWKIFFLNPFVGSGVKAESHNARRIIGYWLRFEVSGTSRSSSLSNPFPILQLPRWRNLLFVFRQARCISDVKADRDHTSFLTGTLSLKEENEVMDPPIAFSRPPDLFDPRF